MEERVQCPVCEEPVDPDRRQVRSSVFVFCCDQCAPRVRHTFDDEGARQDRDPEAA